MADGNPRRLCVSHSPFSEADFGGGEDGSFQVVCPTDLEVDLEKLELVTILSPRKKSLSLQERNMQL